MDDKDSEEAYMSHEKNGKMNLIVALTELKEDEDGEFPWASNNVSSAVFRAHPICETGEVKSGGGKIG